MAKEKEKKKVEARKFKLPWWYIFIGMPKI
jgi:hypothetical protein